MQIKMRKLLAVLAAAAAIGGMTVSVYSDDSAASEETAAEESAEDSGSKSKKTRTVEEVLDKMEKMAENDKLELLYYKKEDLIALKNKTNGYIWWSTPVNAKASNAKGAQVQELLSGMTLTYGDPEKRRTAKLDFKRMFENMKREEVRLK